MIIDRSKFTTEFLSEQPTLCQGQADDLKYEEEGTRIWLSRCGVVDGMPWDNTVTLEVRIDGKWVELQMWDGDNPSEWMNV